MAARILRRSMLAVVVCGLFVQAPGAAAAPLLPDLDQLVPTQLSITPVPGSPVRYFLAFDSRIANGPQGGAGVGPLIVRGRRTSTAAPMIADQVLQAPGGGQTVRRNIGQLHFAISADHRHWHYLAFDRYELRRVSDFKRIAPDNKTGFCMPDETLTPDYCGVNRPDALTIYEGLGPGYVDLYEANLEGQNIEVTGTKKGTYYLVHRVNADSSICESNLSNNAAAMKIRLWPNGYGVAPYFSVLQEYDLFPTRRLQRAPKNCPLDKKAPRLRVQVPRGQHVKGAGGVVAYARCSERCAVRLSGRMAAGGRSYKLVSASKGASARKRVALRARLTGRSLKAVKRAAARGQMLSIRLTLRAVDRVGNRSRARRLTALLRP